MKRSLAIRAFLGPVIAILTLLALTPAWAASQARIVRLSAVEGDVLLDRGDGRGFERAFMNMPVTQGTRVTTGKDGRAEVEFENSSTLRLVPGTTVEFQELSLRDSGAKATSVNLQGGTLYFNVEKQGNDETLISAAGERFSVPKSARFRLEATPAGVQLAVFKGSVEALRANAPIQVKKNHVLDISNSASYELAEGGVPASYDAWDKERDSYRSQYASNARSYGSGFNDLNYYGSFDTVANYGTLWRPYGMNASWSPFMDGAWAFYPGMGYTWVSAYPWGWAPYHYGSWVFVPGYGWGWQPGVMNSWVPVAMVRSAPVGFHPPQAPRAPAGVVAVGRGPTAVSPVLPARLGGGARNRDMLNGRSVGPTTSSAGRSSTGRQSGAAAARESRSAPRFSTAPQMTSPGAGRMSSGGARVPPSARRQ